MSRFLEVYVVLICRKDQGTHLVQGFLSSKSAGLGLDEYVEGNWDKYVQSDEPSYASFKFRKPAREYYFKELAPQESYEIFNTRMGGWHPC